MFALTTAARLSFRGIAFALGSVFAWPLYMVDSEDLDRSFTALQSEPKLLLQSREYR
jgi:hypothetical protein